MAKKICSKELEETERRNRESKSKLEMTLLLQQKEKVLMSKIVSEDCSISFNLRNKVQKAKESAIDLSNKNNQALKNNQNDYVQSSKNQSK